MRSVTRLMEEVLRPGGLLVFHTPRRGVQESYFEERFEPDRRGYGSSALWYLRAEEEPEEAAAEDEA